MISHSGEIERPVQRDVLTVDVQLEVDRGGLGFVVLRRRLRQDRRPLDVYGDSYKAVVETLLDRLR